MENKQNIDWIKEIYRYRSGEMSDIERNSFEKQLQKDPFLADAMEGLADTNIYELRAEISNLSENINRGSKRRAPVFYRVAAAVIVLVGISSILLVRQLKSPDLVSQNLKSVSSDSVAHLNEISSEIVPDITESVDEKKKSEADIVEAFDIIEAEAIVDLPEAREEIRVETIPFTTNVDVDSILSNKLELAEQGDPVLEGRIQGVELVTEESVGVETKKLAKAEAPLRVRGAAAPTSSERKYMAQNVKLVRGRVLDADDNLPLPGVSISKKGTAIGTSSDIDGFFVMEADSGDVLTASFIGMETLEFKIEDKNLDDVFLKPDMMSLDEVVVTAYGVQGRAAGIQTGAVSEIELDDEQSVYTRPLPEQGMAAFRSYIEENLRFPLDWSNTDREVVRVKFTVTIDQKLKDFEIIRSPDSLFSNEAIRVIKEGPTWNPAMNNDIGTEESTSLRIVFRRK